MKRLVVGSVAAVLIGGSADAQTLQYAYDAKVFTAVDAVSMQGSTVVVTGVVQGEQSPSTWAVRLITATAGDPLEWAGLCQRNALIAMAKPGQYLLEIQATTYTYGSVCKLSRVNP